MTGADAMGSDGTVGTGGAPAADAGIDAAAEAGGAGPVDVNDDTGDGDTIDGASEGETREAQTEPVASGDGGIDPTTASAVRIIATHSDKCMGVDANGTADGTRIYQFTCAAATGQVFRFESLGERRIASSIRAVASASLPAAQGNGAALSISACNGGATQAYALQPAGGKLQHHQRRCRQLRRGRSPKHERRRGLRLPYVQQRQQSGVSLRSTVIVQLGTARPLENHELLNADPSTCMPTRRRSAHRVLPRQTSNNPTFVHCVLLYIRRVFLLFDRGKHARTSG